MADLFQGSLLPSTTTTTETQSTAPEFYTNYLQDIANLGQNAVNQGGVAGFSPLQQQAFQMAPTTAFAGAGTATDAATLLRTSGSTAAPDIINAYMNPYTRNVVDEMARLQQQNLQRNVLPSIGASGVGTGGFGSKRQSQALGQSLADMQANLIGQQYGALNTGYQNAMTAAQADLSRMMNAGQGLTNAATTQYNIGSGGLKTLADMGATQQAQGQKELDYPMQQAKAFADLMHGYTIPTGSVTQTVQPGSSGQFSNSPLSQISGLLAAIGSFMNANNASGTSGTSNSSLITDLINALTTPSTTAKDGGSITKYADGGTVAGTDVTNPTIDLNAINAQLQSTIPGYTDTTNVAPQTFTPPTQPDYSQYNLPQDVVDALNNSWQNYANMGYGATDAGYMGYDPVTGTIKGFGGMPYPGSQNNPGMSISDYQAQLAQQAKQKAAFDAAVKAAYPNGVPDAISMQDLMPYLPQDLFPQVPPKQGTGLDSPVDVDQVVNDILMPNNVGSTTDVPVRNTDTPLPYERTTTTPRPQFGRGTKAGRVPAPVVPVDHIKTKHTKLPKPVDQKFQEIDKIKQKPMNAPRRGGLHGVPDKPYKPNWTNFGPGYRQG